MNPEMTNTINNITLNCMVGQYKLTKIKQSAEAEQRVMETMRQLKKHKHKIADVFMTMLAVECNDSDVEVPVPNFSVELHRTFRSFITECTDAINKNNQCIDKYGEDDGEDEDNMISSPNASGYDCDSDKCSSSSSSDLSVSPITRHKSQKIKRHPRIRLPPQMFVKK